MYGRSEEELEKRVALALSPNEAFKHVEWLIENAAQRLAGNDGSRSTAEYIFRTLKDYGVSANIDEIDMFVSLPGKAHLEILSPEKRSIKCIAHVHILSTPLEGIESQIVYAGYGTPDELKQANVIGKIALVDLGGLSHVGKQVVISRHEQNRFAYEAGARAVVQISYGEHIQFGNTKAIVGNPTPEKMSLLPHIPSVGISRGDGDYLKRMCTETDLIVKLVAQSSQGWRKVYQTTAEVKGAVTPDKYIVIGAHCDAWAGGGATDNGTGVALLIELAKVFQQHRTELKRSLRFAWWQGHENATYGGSSWYVENFWDDLNQNAIAYYNCDSPGLRDTHYYRSYLSPELERFQQDVVAKIGTTGKPISLRPPKMGDWIPFLMALGLPLIYERGDYEHHTDWWWWHTDQDTADKVDLRILGEQMGVYATSILRLCNSDILPYNTVALAEEFVSTISDLQQKGKTFFNLADLVEKAANLRSRCSDLDRLAKALQSHYEKAVDSKARSEINETFTELNFALMKLSKCLNNIIYSRAGKYDFDAFALYGQSKGAIPILQPINQLIGLDPEKPYYKLLITKLRKDRNRVSDALSDAMELVASAMKKADNRISLISLK